MDKQFSIEDCSSLIREQLLSSWYCNCSYPTAEQLFTEIAQAEQLIRE
jgi:hypothetical protein